MLKNEEFELVKKGFTTSIRETLSRGKSYFCAM